MSRGVVLITGASSGLGKEFAQIFARQSYDLLVVARREELLEELKQSLESRYGINVWVYVQDLAEIDAAQKIYNFTQEYRLPIQILINNAGFADHGPFVHSDWQKQFNMVQVNIVALMQLSRLFLPEMLAQGYGRILNVSSVAGVIAGPGMSIYYASKAFVTSFSEALSEEVRGSGVNVTALCPGPTATGFSAAAGVTNTAMFRMDVAAARDVAEYGYWALMNGRPVVYYGLMAKLLKFGTRFAPRSLSRKIAARINR